MQETYLLIFLHDIKSPFCFVQGNIVTCHQTLFTKPLEWGCYYMAFPIFPLYVILFTIYFWIMYLTILSWIFPSLITFITALWTELLETSRFSYFSNVLMFCFHDSKGTNFVLLLIFEGKKLCHLDTTVNWTTKMIVWHVIRCILRSCNILGRSIVSNFMFGVST